jgi:hypothetical protein
MPTSIPGVYRGGRYGQPQTPAARAAVTPGQRPGGTVYGGQTVPPGTNNAEATMDVSGSLTGLILSRGRTPAQQEARRKKERRSRIRTGLFITLGTLLFFGLLGLVVAILAGDFISALFRAMTH